MNKEPLSELIHKELKKTFNETSYMLWLSDVKIIFSEHEKIKIVSPSPFKAQIIESVLYKDIENVVANVLGFSPKDYDYLFVDENGNIMSILEFKTRQKQLDEMNDILNYLVKYIIEHTNDETILYIAPDIKKATLTIEDGKVTLDFKDIVLLKVVRKYCTDILIEVLTTYLKRGRVKLEFRLNGVKYEE